MSSPRLSALRSTQRELGRKGVKAAVKRLYESVGGKVYNTSGQRMFGNTPGLPDLIVFVPLKGRRIVLWHEAKAAKGKANEAQLMFRALADEAHTVHVTGGLEEARIALVTLGVLAL